MDAKETKIKETMPLKFCKKVLISLSWGIWGVIFLMAVAGFFYGQSVNPDNWLSYALKLLFYLFWVIVCISYFFLLYCSKLLKTVVTGAGLKTKNLRDRMQEYIESLFKSKLKFNKTFWWKIISNCFIFAIGLVLIAESFSFFPIGSIYKLVFLVFAVSTSSFYIIPVNITYIRVKKMSVFIKQISVLITVFVTVSFIPKIERVYINDAFTIDKVLFSHFAAYHGDNYDDILRSRLQDMASDLSKQSPNKDFSQIFTIYLRRFEYNKLSANLLPSFRVTTNQTIHSLFFYHIFNRLSWEETSIESWLEMTGNIIDYLLFIGRRGNYLATINREEVKLDFKYRYSIDKDFFDFLVMFLKKNLVGMRRSEAYRQKIVPRLKALYHVYHCDRHMHTGSFRVFFTTLKEEVPPCQ